VNSNITTIYPKTGIIFKLNFKIEIPNFNLKLLILYPISYILYPISYILYIKPTLTADRFGEAFLYNGTLDLYKEGCNVDIDGGCYV
jgi:hypothetical protein